MRPTRSGATVACSAVAAIAVGRVLGLPELYAIGSTLAVLALVTALWVAVRGYTLEVRRAVQPDRVHVGVPATVEIAVANAGRRATPVLRVRDPVSGTAGADLLLPPVRPGRPTTIAYRLPTARRGLVRVGPMGIEMTDPFGLARATSQAAGSAEVTILPRVDDIPPLPRSVGPDPDGVTETGSLGRAGEDFAALRPYVPGDDLRRVHWLTSARTDELLVKQHDLPWQGRLCLVVDQRRLGGDPEAFERAVSAAASIVRAHLNRGDHVRLVGTDASDTGHGLGPGHLSAVLEQLAVIEQRGGSLATALAAAESGGSGALVVVSARPAPEDLDQLDAVAPTFRRRRLVHFDGAVRSSSARGTEILGVGSDETFTAVWGPSVRRRRPVGRVAR